MLYTIIIALLLAAVVGLLIWNRERALLHTINIAELIPDALLIVDETGKIKFANRNAEQLFGYTKQEMYALSVEDLMPERYRHMHKKQRGNFNHGPSVRPMGMGRDLCILTKEGKEVEAEIALSPAPECIMSKSTHTIVLLHDITERKRIEHVINDLAYKDQLTGIPNRTSFYEHSKELIDRSISDRRKLAFIIIDIRELKRINDTLGHYSGDDVIQKTGFILKGFLHDHMCEDDDVLHLFKISGNEFLFTVEYDDDTAECADSIACGIIETFRKPLRLDGMLLDIHIDVNMGISVLPVHGMTASQLLKTADIALVKSKQQGKNTYCYYNNTMNIEFENFTIYENAIRYFIKTNDFDISFQPVWNIHKKKYTGAEVLFRCNERIYPDMRVDFLINVAESTGLIVPLGNAILERACQEGMEHELITDNEIVISVNASIQQLEQPDFSERVIGILENTNVKPENFAIEITETTLMNREIQAIEKIEKLRDHGIRIFIDDFGKGFSSLAYLNKIPADKLKIDMSFLTGIETEKSSMEILRGIIQLGHAIELMVCTEGVETKEQLNILKDLDGDEVQGYLIGKPVPGDQLKLEHPEMFNSDD